MLYFEEVYLLPKYPASIFIQWSLNLSSLPENYYFNIYLSDNPNDGYTKITQTPIVNSYFYEHSMGLLTKEEYLWIKIEAIAGDHKTISEPQGLFYNLDKRQFLIAKEIIRKKDLLREKKVGLKSLVFKRKVFAPPCPKCIDIHTGFGTDSKCLECYGTKKIGGYHAPIETWVEIVEGPREIKQTEIGVTEDRFAIANLTFPIVQKGDIIVERKRNKRWHIESIEREALQTIPVDQRATVGQIAPKDIEYKLGAS